MNQQTLGRALALNDEIAKAKNAIERAKRMHIQAMELTFRDDEDDEVETNNININSDVLKLKFTEYSGHDGDTYTAEFTMNPIQFKVAVCSYWDTEVKQAIERLNALEAELEAL